MSSWNVFHIPASDSCTLTQYSIDFTNEELDLTKTTPKRSTYEEENHQWLHLRWSELDSQGEMALDSFSCCCHLKLPQQVALTAFNKQVNAQVGVIGRTEFFSNSSWTMWWKNNCKISNTTPADSTCCFQKSCLCLCKGKAEDKLIAFANNTKYTVWRWPGFLKTYNQRHRQRKTIISEYFRRFNINLMNLQVMASV